MEGWYDGLFKLGTNYKETFRNEVKKLIIQDLTVDFKNKIVQTLTDSYIEQTGERPDSYELSKLATWIVEDKDNDPDKVSKTEYPILSISQIKLRRRREIPNQFIENITLSGKYKINGIRKPKSFKVFGNYGG